LAFCCLVFFLRFSLPAACYLSVTAACACYHALRTWVCVHRRGCSSARHLACATERLRLTTLSTPACYAYTQFYRCSLFDLRFLVRPVAGDCCLYVILALNGVRAWRTIPFAVDCYRCSATPAAATSAHRWTTYAPRVLVLCLAAVALACLHCSVRTFCFSCLPPRTRLPARFICRLPRCWCHRRHTWVRFTAGLVRIGFCFLALLHCAALPLPATCRARYCSVFCYTALLSHLLYRAALPLYALPHRHMYCSSVHPAHTCCVATVLAVATHHRAAFLLPACRSFSACTVLPVLLRRLPSVRTCWFFRLPPLVRVACYRVVRFNVTVTVRLGLVDGDVPHLPGYVLVVTPACSPLHTLPPPAPVPGLDVLFSGMAILPGYFTRTRYTPTAPLRHALRLDTTIPFPPAGP